MAQPRATRPRPPIGEASVDRLGRNRRGAVVLAAAALMLSACTGGIAPEGTYPPVSSPSPEAAPTARPTSAPTALASAAPTVPPSAAPTAPPSAAPTPGASAGPIGVPAGGTAIYVSEWSVGLPTSM